MDAFLRLIIDARPKDVRPWEGVPRIEGELSPRGLRRCLPFAEPTWSDPLGIFKRTPDVIGSDIRNAVTPYGRGPVTTINNLFNNSVGYANEQPGKFSMEALFVMGAVSGTMQLVLSLQGNATGTSGGNSGQLGYTTSGISASIFDGATKTATDTTTTLTAGKLYHVVYTSDGSNLVLYTNGAQTASVACGTIGGGTVPFIVCNGRGGGGSNSNSTNLLVNYANVAWTAGEVAARAVDPFGFLIWPEDDILAQVLGGGSLISVLPGGSWGEAAYGRRAWGLPPLATVLSSQTFNKLLTLTQGETASLRRAGARVVSLTEVEQLSLVRQAGKLILPTSAEVTTLTTAKAKLTMISLTSGEAVAAQRQIAKTLPLSGVEAVTLQRQAGRQVALVSNETVTLSTVKVKLLSITVSQAQVVSAARRVGKVITTASSQAVSLARQVGRIVVVVSSQVVTLPRQVGRTISAPLAAAVTLVRIKVKLLSVAVAQTQAITLARQVGKTVSVASSELLAVTRAIGRLVLVSQAQTLSQGRQVGKLAALTSSKAVTLIATRSAAGHVVNVAVALGQAMAMVRQIGKTTLAASSQGVSSQRTVGKRLVVAQPEAVVLAKGRAFLKTLTAPLNQAVALVQRQLQRLLADPLFVVSAVAAVFTASYPRNPFLVVVQRGMTQANDLPTAIDDTVEEVTVTFDFGTFLQSGITITSITSVACSVYQGADPSAASRVVGAPQIGASPSTGQNSQAVLVLVGTMIGGTIYTLQCQVMTSDNQAPSVTTRVRCRIRS